MVRVRRHEDFADVIADRLNKVDGRPGHRDPHRVPHLLQARPRGRLQPRPRRRLSQPPRPAADAGGSPGCHDAERHDHAAATSAASQRAVARPPSGRPRPWPIRRRSRAPRGPCPARTAAVTGGRVLHPVRHRQRQGDAGVEHDGVAHRPARAGEHVLAPPGRCARRRRRAASRAGSGTGPGRRVEQVLPHLAAAHPPHRRRGRDGELVEAVVAAEDQRRPCRGRRTRRPSAAPSAGRRRRPRHTSGWAGLVSGPRKLNAVADAQPAAGRRGVPHRRVERLGEAERDAGLARPPRPPAAGSASG